MTQYHAVTLAGFSLTGTDAAGVRWTVEGLPGWFGAPSMRTDRPPRAQQSGSWDGKGHADERIITLHGKMFALSTPAMERAARELDAVLADGGAGRLEVSSEFGTLSALVRLDVAPDVTPLSSTIASWSLTVAASDPLLYGSPVFRQAFLAGTAPGDGLTYPLTYPLDYGVPPGVTPGAVELPNEGTAAYWPRLRIDGPVPNPVVTNVTTGAWVRYNGTVPAGQWVDFDLAARRVLLRGQVSVRRLVSSSGDWLAVPRGGASLAWTADAADPAALLSVWGYEGAWS